ncbi:MAG: DUF1592 domain-containing protein [Roseimicrobium sp.]
MPPLFAALLLAAPMRDPFPQSIQPLLKEYCITCHSTEKQKGDLDLERFTSLSHVKRDPSVWEHSLDQIRDKEMPPKGKPQPSPEQMKRLTDWMQSTLDEIALANAGDPGPVVLRRLSNREYTYTVRDLTGVATLDPAKEFPVDGAAGEGFTNAGAALVMSPALLTKYLDAAKDIANHAVLTPESLHFSPSTSSRDWTDETLAKIREFYARFTERGSGTAVNLQGIKFDTNAGGRLPVAPYLAALQGKGSSDGLNAKYLATLRAAFTDPKPSLVLDLLREKYRVGTLVAADVAAWQQSLWRFASVGHIGKTNGPKSWQEPVTPLAAQHELRVKLKAPADRSEVTLYLSAGDASRSGAKGGVIWENARLVTKGSKDLPLREVAGAGPDVMHGQANSLIEVRIPAAQIQDTEFVVTAKLDTASDAEAALQVKVLTSKPDHPPSFSASPAESSTVVGKWSDNNLRTMHNAPILVNDGSAARKQFVTAFEDFRALFPIALCYTKIVPVDEVVTLTLFHREDEPLQRLMLDDAQRQALARLWDELHFVSESPLKQVDVFEQLWQFATQDAKPEAFEPMRTPILRGAEAFQKLKAAVEPRHVQAALDFARRAWRRPLTNAEQNDLRSLYQKLRKQDLPHADAVRLLLARVLVAPAFLYRGEKAAPGLKAAPVSDWELATRLSYFLWSSAPDDELRALAAGGKLHEPDALAAQTQRMLKSDNVRRLATEFGCQWLHVRDVETLDEKSERHFPTFLDLRGDMQEEVTRFFIDLIQNNRSIISLLDADHTFVNAGLAAHYGMKAEKWGPKNQAAPSPASDWQRVGHLRAQGRGGILGFAATLAKQAGASRNSAILRGTWLTEVVLGEKLPIPPKGVPVLPEEPPGGLTERQLIERHSSDERCAGCHKRIDPFGFALEGFDAIGRARQANTKTTLPDGTVVDGLSDLRDYLLTKRRDDFARQCCRKLLGYALGRSVQLSDKPLIEQMVKTDLRFGTLVEHIVRSPQFREVRGGSYKVD